MKLRSNGGPQSQEIPNGGRINCHHWSCQRCAVPGIEAGVLVLGFDNVSRLEICNKDVEVPKLGHGW
jgi:hypothetical protein